MFMGSCHINIRQILHAQFVPREGVPLSHPLNPGHIAVGLLDIISGV
jgi:hypothetical protein